MNHAEAVAKVRKRRDTLTSQTTKLRHDGRNVEADLVQREKHGVVYALSQMERIDQSRQDFRLFFAWLKARITRYRERSIAAMSPRQVRVHHARLEELLAVQESAEWHLYKKHADHAVAAGGRA